jgi:hypothetical protein
MTEDSCRMARRQSNLAATVEAVRKERDRYGVLKIETEADLDRLVASHARLTVIDEAAHGDDPRAA